MSIAIKDRIVEIKIIAFSKKGNGLGVLERPNAPSLNVEVPFTAPGDVVRARLLRKNKDVYAAKLEEVITKSDRRISPKCVHFGSCGGCRLQHISYEDQLSHKTAFVNKCFADLLTPEVEVRPTVASTEPWHYRNKMEYTFTSDLSGKKFLGLVMDSTKGKVFNITECHLSHSWFLDAVKAIRHWWNESEIDAYHIFKNTGSLRTLTLREGQRTGDRMVVLTVSGNPDFSLKRHQLESFVAFVRDAVEPTNPSSLFSIFLRIQQVGKGMPTNVYEMRLYGSDHIRETMHIKVYPDEPSTALNFDISPSAFFQPNTQQAETLYSTAVNIAQVPRDAVVYDLYCGTGSMGLCISKYVKQVIGIEISPESALDARTNAKHNGCHNVTIISGAVRHVLNQLLEQNVSPPDIMLMDPPRPGLDPEAIKHILTLKPKKILYISCNPVTQALNVKELLQHGYRLNVLQAVDQFPQTSHIETIALLSLC